MGQQHYGFGGGIADTVLHPIVLAAMIVAAVLILTLPRKYVIIPFLFSTFLIPIGQQIFVGGVHLFVIRLLILVGLVRVAISSEGTSKWAGGWMSIDTAFTFYIVIQAAATLLLNQDSSAFINQIGLIWDCLGGYLLVRALIRDRADIRRTIQCLAILCVLLSIGMIIEQVKSMNVFGLLGGVNLVPEVRDGKIRSQAVFQHSLTAGTFAATSLPLFLLLWRERKARVLAVLGIAAATTMVFTTQTSTSLVTFGGGLIAVCFWPIRASMRNFRRGLLGALIVLHLVMKAPVWFLIARVDLTGSSSSYHRAELVDQFINHFSSWWLIGTKDFATWGWDMWDAQNMYVSVGEAGGLAAFIFFILVISRSFARLGLARKRVENKRQEWFLWFLGAAMFAHLTAFMGVNYFDQVRIAWYAEIAMICAYTAPFMRSKPSTKLDPTKVATGPENSLAFSPSAANVRENEVFRDA